MRPDVIEWTGEAHLVTTGCDECGRSFSIDEDSVRWADERGRPVFCDSCGSGGL